MKAAEWIDRVKSAHGWDSDYRVAKELGLSRQVVSKYRSNTVATMDEVASLKVADALGAPPEFVLIDQTMERTKNDEARQALAGLLDRLSQNPAVKGLCIMLSCHRDALAAMASAITGQRRVIA